MTISQAQHVSASLTTITQPQANFSYTPTAAVGTNTFSSIYNTGVTGLPPNTVTSDQGRAGLTNNFQISQMLSPPTQAFNPYLVNPVFFQPQLPYASTSTSAVPTASVAPCGQPQQAQSFSLAEQLSFMEQPRAWDHLTDQAQNTMQRLIAENPLFNRAGNDANAIRQLPGLMANYPAQPPPPTPGRPNIWNYVPRTLELFNHVPVTTRDKVVRGEYVDFATLLPNHSGDSDSLELKATPGGFSLQPKNHTKKIDGFHKWLRAYRTFMGIYLWPNPTPAVDMLQYMELIHNTSSQYAWQAVYSFDIMVRQEQAQHPATSWSDNRLSLYTRNLVQNPFAQLTSGQQSKPKTFSQQTNRPNSRQNTKPSNTADPNTQVCLDFNKGACTHKPCKFSHTCSKCFKPGHPATKCWGGSKPGGAVPSLLTR